ISVLYLYNIQNKFISKSIFLLLIYYLSLTIANYKNSTLDIDALIPLIMGISFALLLNYTLQNNEDLNLFLLALNILIYLYVVINLSLIYIYPDGIPSIIVERGRQYYLFGNVNTAARYLLPGLMF